MSEALTLSLFMSQPSNPSPACSILHYVNNDIFALIITSLFIILVIVIYLYIFKSLGKGWIKDALNDNGSASSSRLIAFLATILFLILIFFMGIVGIYLIVSGQGEQLKDISGYFSFLYTPMIAYIPYAFNNIKNMVNPPSSTQVSSTQISSTQSFSTTSDT